MERYSFVLGYDANGAYIERETDADGGYVSAEDCDHLRAVNAELMEALEEMLYVFVDADVFPTENDTVDKARAAIRRARG